MRVHEAAATYLSDRTMHVLIGRCSARNTVAQCRGLLYCMEYLEENLDDWLGEELEVSLPWLLC